MGSIGLGDVNRFIKVIPDYDEPYPDTKKLTKFKDRLTMAEDVAFLPGNRAIVCDRRKQSVRIYDEGGEFSNTLAKSIRPMGIATTPRGMVAVIDSTKQNKEKYIKVFSSDNGDLFSKWGDGMDWRPRGIAFNNKGQLVISNVMKGSHSIGVYTLDGHVISTFGKFGKLSRNFKNPYYLTVDLFDRIIVSDKDNHCIKIFDERGGFLGKIGGYGSYPGLLCFPRGVCTDSRGNIFVCDTGNKRVCVFSLDGRFIQNLLDHKDCIGNPFGIAFDKDSGRLVVSQHHTARESGHIRKVRVYELDKLSAMSIVREDTLR